MNQRRDLYISLTILLGSIVAQQSSLAAEFAGKPYKGGDVFADTWVVTDGAGRALPDAKECGPPRKDRTVGIFYWTWHTAGRNGPFDVTKILAEAKARGGEVKWPPAPEAYHWGEPELGYYRMTDPFVIRKHASMLADAGVDVVIFDTTNPPATFRDEYEALCREYTAMRAEGARTPAIAFIGPFGDPRPVTDQLWNDLYKPGKWKDLWFQWQGKPLLLADKAFIKERAIRDFFTFRKPMPDYWVGPSGTRQWSWLEVHPQHVFRDPDGKAEQMSVGVAQNAVPGIPGPSMMSHKAGAMGRSWHGGKKDERPDAVNLGLNFQEQWDRAREVDPRFLFVTGWNEWTSGRYPGGWSKFTADMCYHPGGLFVDEYDQEYSRDCEPMRGGHTDNYYYQLVANIRRYKGIRPRPRAAGPSPIKVDGAFEDWAAVTPEFRDTIGDTTHRDHKGYGDTVYREDSGRNDFVIAKAAYDDADVSFFAQTRGPISPRSGASWMLLFLDADRDVKTGPLGYDFLVNREVAGDAETTVQAWRGGKWETVGRARCKVSGNGLEVAIPRALIGQAGKAPAFDFHWADNIRELADPAAFGVEGDSAPNRRANYRYEVGP